MTESKILLQKVSIFLGIVFFLLAIFLIDVFLLLIAGMVFLFFSPVAQAIIELNFSVELVIFVPFVLFISLSWSYILFVIPNFLNPFWDAFEKIIKSFSSSEFIDPPKPKKGEGIIPWIFYVPNLLAIIINLLLILAVIYYISLYNINIMVKIFLDPPLEYVIFIHVLLALGMIMRNKKRVTSVSN